MFSHSYPLTPLSIVLTVAHPVGAIYFSLQLFDSVKIKDGGRSDYIIAHVMQHDLRKRSLQLSYTQHEMRAFLSLNPNITLLQQL